MEMSKRVAFVAVALSWFVSVPAVAQDGLWDEARRLFQPIPLAPPAIKGIESTPSRVELGKMLYFDPRLSESHTISCNSCHILGLGGVDVLENSIGHRWQRGARNVPTVLNAVFNTAQFWDGRATDLEEQAGGRLVDHSAMGSTREHVVEQIKGVSGYLGRFREAFPGQDDPIRFENVQNLIALFEATLITPDAPFDRWLRGQENAMTREERDGLEVFIRKGCANCHNGINVGGGMYAPFGVVEQPGAELLPPTDKGRFEVTKTATDEYVFKVPTLRNVVLTPPYFHSGKAWDLRQAVAVMGTAQLGASLSAAEVDKIVAFLHSLSGRQPEITYPFLPPSGPETPRPRP
jgi:cytochrome c peroxidase